MLKYTAMNKRLSISRILVYFDIPQIFTAVDRVETLYLCLLTDIDDVSGEMRFISTPISESRLMQFYIGDEDLRNIFVNPELKEIYSFKEISEFIQAELLDSYVLSASDLPDEGFRYQDIDHTETIITESHQRNKAIVHLALSDDGGDYSIDSDDLGDVLKLYQLIMEKTYKKELINRKVRDKKRYFHPTNYTFRAFESSSSSFNIHLFSTAETDVFGHTPIEFGLEKFTSMISQFLNEDDYIDILRTVKGHSVANLKKLMKKIIDNNLTLKHKWYVPNKKAPTLTIINPINANQIFKILNSTEDLSEEIREFSGVFIQVDVEKGTWRFKDDNEDLVLSGSSTGNMLPGITVETQQYRIECNEIIESLKVSEREKIHYILERIVQI